MTSSDSPQSEFRDELARMKHEINALCNSVEVLKKELSLCRDSIAEMRKEPSGGLSDELISAEQAVPRALKGLCNNYLEIVSTIDIARQVFLAEDAGTATIWTILDDPPAEDSSHAPLYNEQLKTLSILRDNLPVEFCLLNASELLEGKQTEDIIPSHARLIWER